MQTSSEGLRTHSPPPPYSTLGFHPGLGLWFLTSEIWIPEGQPRDLAIPRTWLVPSATGAHMALALTPFQMLRSHSPRTT